MRNSESTQCAALNLDQRYAFSTVRRTQAIERAADAVAHRPAVRRRRVLDFADQQ